MKLTIPDAIAQRLQLGETELTEILAVSLYKMAKINGVAGGEMLGISEMEFHGVVKKYGQFVNYDSGDLHEDIEHLTPL